MTIHHDGLEPALSDHDRHPTAAGGDHERDLLSRFYGDYIRRGPVSDVRDDRVVRIMNMLLPETKRMLDIGCGTGRHFPLYSEAAPQAEIHGIDVGEGVEDLLARAGFFGKRCDASSHIDYPDHSFDTVICGEVIEHVINTDNLLRQIHRVLKPFGQLILTTPNLAYLPNRVLLLLGIQPIFTETSLTTNMGRRLRLLGQGNRTQGHLKIFTKAALCELLSAEGFSVDRIVGYRWISRGPASHIDRFLTLRATWAAGFVVSARAAKSV